MITIRPYNQPVIKLLAKTYNIPEQLVTHLMSPITRWVTHPNIRPDKNGTKKLSRQELAQYNRISQAVDELPDELYNKAMATIQKADVQVKLTPATLSVPYQSYGSYWTYEQILSVSKPIVVNYAPYFRKPEDITAVQEESINKNFLKQVSSLILIQQLIQHTGINPNNITTY